MVYKLLIVYTVEMNDVKPYVLSKLARLRLLMMAVVVLLLYGCGTETPHRSFDENMLIGKWVSGSEYYRFDFGYQGATWDLADDVQESEAQVFSWSLAEDRLLLVHQMEMGADIPKMYTVILLDNSILQIDDVYGNRYVYQRVL